MRVKCLAQEHNTMSQARARARSARSGVERFNHEANTFNNATSSYHRPTFSIKINVDIASPRHEFPDAQLGSKLGLLTENVAISREGTLEHFR